MASKKKTVRFTDSSLINNDVLRPWTIDLNLDRRLQQESSALDKILSFTTPQKFAGTLASSVLDSAPDEYKEFRSTLEQRMNASKFGVSAQVPQSEPGSGGKSSNSNSQRGNSDSSRLRNEFGEKLPSGRRSGVATPSVETYQDCFEAADLAYIERVKHSMYSKSMRTMRAKTAHTAPIQSIRYSQEPFGPISPTKSKLLLMTYHNPKLNASMSVSKIPIVRNSMHHTHSVKTKM
jgi:hypothetical protein